MFALNPVIRVGGGYRRLSWKVMSIMLLQPFLVHCHVAFINLTSDLEVTEKCQNSTSETSC